MGNFTRSLPGEFHAIDDEETADGAATAPGDYPWWGRLVVGQVDGSGLKYQRNRFYDPLTGQFTQSDPIGLAGGKNLYAFAGGDPVNYTDPFGLCPDGRGGDDRRPCTLGNVVAWNVSWGLQLGASFTTGLIGGEAKVQGWKVFNLTTSKTGTELWATDAEASLELKGSALFGLAQGGFKMDALAKGPKLTGGSSFSALSQGNERNVKTSGGTTSKFGAQVGLGFELQVNWDAARALMKQSCTSPMCRK